MLQSISDYINKVLRGEKLLIAGKTAQWKKVNELKEGMKIAVINTSDGGPERSRRDSSEVKFEEIVSIKKVGREKVWDIEIEGTHNFVGNGILAHNTYISGNVGIGTTGPGAKLDIYTGNGTSGLKTSLICSDATTSKLYTDASGNVVCGTDQTGGGSGNIVDTLAATLGAGADAGGITITTLGNLYTVLGLVGTPAYSFTGDTDTGMWSSAANTLNFSTAGSERMRVDSNGNVGIGTTAPGAYKLNVAGTAKMTGFQLGTSTTSGYVLTADTSGVGTWQAGLWTDGGAISYLTATTDDVALGGSTSSSPFYLDVSANSLRLGSGSTADAVLNMYSSGGETGSITYNHNDYTGNGFWDFEGGKVNLGTGAASTSTLSMYGDLRLMDSSTTDNGWVFENTHTASYNMVLSHKNYSNYNTDNVICAAQSVQSAYVGIGKCTTSWMFEVAVNSAGKPAGGSWGDSSDIRLKTDVQPITNALDLLTKLQGVHFRWINPEEHGNLTGIQGGFIAQELEKTFPGWVSEINPNGSDQSLVTPGEKVKGLSLPFEFDALVVEAIKEQQTEISNMNVGIGSLTDQFTTTSGQLVGLETSIDDLGNLVATEAAKLTDFQENTNDQLSKTTSLELRLASLENQVASLSAQLTDIKTLSFLPTADATLSAQLTNTPLATSATSSATLESLVVTGKSTFADVGVTGKITIGLLIIDGLSSSPTEECVSPLPDEPCGESPSTSLGASISTLAGPLKLQELALGNLEMMAGKVVIDTKGNVKIEGNLNVAGNITSEGKIAAKEYKVDTAEPQTASLGKATLPAGQTRVLIETTVVASGSAVFVTPETLIDLPLTVTALDPAVSFTVEVSRPQDKEIKFSWWVVN